MATATEENPRRRRRRRNPETKPTLRVVAPAPEENPRRRRRRNPEDDAPAPEANPRRRRRGGRRRRTNPRKKNIKGTTIALIALGVVVGVPAILFTVVALTGAKLMKDVSGRTTMV